MSACVTDAGLQVVECIAATEAGCGGTWRGDQALGEGRGTRRTQQAANNRIGVVQVGHGQFVVAELDSDGQFLITELSCGVSPYIE